jgi:hypothetical protein
MLTEQDGLWFKVLVAKYGVEDVRILGGQKASRCRKDVCEVRESVGLSVGRWFENKTSKAGESFCPRFNRIF